MSAIYLGELGLAKLLVLGALFAMLDGTVKITAVFSRKVGRDRYPDFVLLAFVGVCCLSAMKLLAITTDGPHPLVNYLDVNDLKLEMARRRAFVSDLARAKPFVTAIQASLALGALASFILAMKRGRSLVAWLPLSVLCNLGGVLWLLSSTVSRRTVER